MSATKNFSSLLPLNWKDNIAAWLKEDIPSFDYGGYVVGEKEEYAILWGKSEAVVAGVPFFTEVFTQLDCRVEWNLKEGTHFVEKTEVARVYGKSKNILQGERLALNILSRCSAIAFKGLQLNQLKQKHQFKGIIAGTRKTTPGFRLVEKYGMLVGGIDTHRMDLSSMIMLKDNHIWSHGSITSTIDKAREVGGFSLKIEVEVQNEGEAVEAIQAGGDIIMLDNLKPPEIHTVAKQLKLRFNNTSENPKQFLLEASGGIDIHNIEPYFGDDIDVISLGSMTQGVPHVDFSLKIQKVKH
ncbi:nicotinate-nucleotide diphosphorylase [Neoconidiobolus thromboides FSU 785]|nr:nicotinate-nucleotide diphosphorylase [Neoconidiobolus thromboides FSU 785]